MKFAIVFFALALVGTTCCLAKDEYDDFYEYIEHHQKFIRTDSALIKLNTKTSNPKAKKLHYLIKYWIPAHCNSEPYTSIYSPKLRETDQDSKALADYIAECEKQRQILCHLNNADWEDPKTVEYLSAQKVQFGRLNERIKEHMDELKKQSSNWDCDDYLEIGSKYKYEILNHMLDSVKVIVDPLLKEYNAYCGHLRKTYLDFHDVAQAFKTQFVDEYATIAAMGQQLDKEYLTDVNKKDIKAVESAINKNYKSKWSLFGNSKAKKAACEKYIEHVGNNGEQVLSDKSGQAEYFSHSLKESSTKLFGEIRAYIYCKKVVQE